MQIFTILISLTLLFQVSEPRGLPAAAVRLLHGRVLLRDLAADEPVNVIDAAPTAATTTAAAATGAAEAASDTARQPRRNR